MVSFVREVSSSLWKVKGSVWLSVAIGVVVYLLLYTVLSLVYRFALDEDRKCSFLSLLRS